MKKYLIAVALLFSINVLAQSTPMKAAYIAPVKTTKTFANVDTTTQVGIDNRIFNQLMAELSRQGFSQVKKEDAKLQIEVEVADIGTVDASKRLRDFTPLGAVRNGVGTAANGKTQQATMTLNFRVLNAGNGKAANVQTTILKGDRTGRKNDNDLKIEEADFDKQIDAWAKTVAQRIANPNKN